MKRSRRTPPARTEKRDTYDDAAEQAARPPEYSFGISEDEAREISNTYMPLSLRTGAGGQYWDETLQLLVRIRAECDAAAERLGYTSPQDDGLAAVEFIANRILNAVRGERQQQIGRIKNAPQASSWPSAGKQTPTAAAHGLEKGVPPASLSERSKVIDKVKSLRRDRKTGSCGLISPQV